jgi:hypothetical protein
MLLASCAATPPPATTAEADAVADADSLKDSAYDAYFIEIYGEVLDELGRRERDGPADVHVIEARSIVDIAEGVYLEGNTVLAIKLVEEAQQLLRRGS